MFAGRLCWRRLHDAFSNDWSEADEEVSRFGPAEDPATSVGTVSTPMRSRKSLIRRERQKRGAPRLRLGTSDSSTMRVF